MKKIMLVLALLTMVMVAGCNGDDETQPSRPKIIDWYCVEGHGYGMITVAARLFVIPLFDETGHAKKCVK